MQNADSSKQSEIQNKIYEISSSSEKPVIDDSIINRVIQKTQFEADGNTEKNLEIKKNWQNYN